MKVLARIVLVACVSMIAAGLTAWGDPNALPVDVAAVHPAPGPVEVAAPAVPSAAPDSLTSPEVLCFSSPTLSRYWTVAADRKSLRISTYELFPQGEVGVFHQDVSTTLSIRDVASRGGDELFVGGNPLRGGFVLERWRLPEVRGSTTAMLVPSGAVPGGIPVTPGMGVPTQPWGGQVYIPGGVSQTPIVQRIALPPVQRSEFAEDVSALYRGIGADPEGRFVLVLTDAGELRQYSPSVTLNDYVVLQDATTMPQLMHVEGLFHRVQHTALGRVWFLTWHDARYPDGTLIPSSLYETIVIVDGDNDGVFEEVTPHFVDGTTIDAYLDRAQWLDAFMSAS